MLARAKRARESLRVFMLNFSKRENVLKAFQTFPLLFLSNFGVGFDFEFVLEATHLANLSCVCVGSGACHLVFKNFRVTLP